VPASESLNGLVVSNLYDGLNRWITNGERFDLAGNGVQWL
jgi:hypothetical protein